MKIAAILALLLTGCTGMGPLTDAGLVFVSWQYAHPSVKSDEPLPYSQNYEEWEE